MPQLTCRIVEICIFRFVKDRAEYLLLHRSKSERVYPGIWQLMSGTIENDEPALKAALREFNEETGMKVGKFWVVPYVNSFFDPEYDAVNLSPLFAAQVDEGSEPHLSSEHYEYGWFPYDEALRKLVWPGQKTGLRVVHEHIVRGGQAASILEMKIDRIT
jgi:8-oxo-dGTP pyrophosphatase MutT (NUDIX family)